MNAISILGSTGSIGRQTLEVAAALHLRVAALAAHRSVALLETQARQFKPHLVAVVDENAAVDLRVRLADTAVRVVSGPQGLEEAAVLTEADIVLTAVSGMVGLKPTLTAIRAGKTIALANKETLVCAGELVMAEAVKYKTLLLPVDSEHSAIFQCLQGNRDRGEVKRLILTASGGPFFSWDRARLAGVTREQALRHPNWAMGPKITVDSATMMNKGMEIIEAARLYGLPQEKISVVIHRESIIHSLVEYCDNAVLAQLGAPDMRLPIQYALTWPRRVPGPAETLNLLSCPPLTFAEPDRENFPCLGLAEAALREGELACAVMNGANEAAVALFLEDKLGFLDIPERVADALAKTARPVTHTLEDILAADRLARETVFQGRRHI